MVPRNNIRPEFFFFSEGSLLSQRDISENTSMFGCHDSFYHSLVFVDKSGKGSKYKV